MNRTFVSNRIVKRSTWLLLVLASCATTEIRPGYELHTRGDFAGAAREIGARIQDQSRFKTEDTIWLLLEYGKALQDAGEWAASNTQLEKAMTLIENHGDKAFISVHSLGNELESMQSDDRQLDYLGTLPDRVLIHTAMAINYAMLGDLESAAANVRAQLKRQQEAVALNSKRVAEIDRRRVQDQGRQPGMQQNGQFYAPFPDFENQSGLREEMRRMMGIGGMDGYSDYHAPFGYALGAILLGAAGRDAEQATYAELAADPRLKVQFQGTATPPGNEVIVVFENGVAPARVDGSFQYMGPNGPTKVPVPKMQLRTDGRAAGLRIEGPATAIEAQFVDSVDGIVVTDFRNALPIIWFRAMTQVMIKEMQTYLLRKEAAEKGGSKHGGVNVAEFGVLMASAVARNVVSPDLRSWQSLPGEHRMARFPRPNSEQLTFTLYGSGGMRGASQIVSLPAVPGPVLVYVRSTAINNIQCHAVPLIHGAPR